MLVAYFAKPAGTSREHELVRTRPLSDTTLLVTAFGEVDAASAGDFYNGIVRHLHGGYRQVVLDLSRLAFFGTAGYSALHEVDAYCANAAADWVIVPGPEVQRLMRVCDPEGRLPTAPNIVSAVATLTRRPHRTPQLSRRR